MLLIALLLTRGVEQYGKDDQCAFDNLLVIRLHAEQIEAVIHHPDNQHAEEGADQRTDAAGHAGAADHHRRDGVQLIPCAGIGLRRTGARREDQAGDAGQRAAQRIHQYFDAVSR